ncbi:MAG TPA: FAD:protein FMN transferase [Kineosporiaceae bacterium]|nr:FAD:protein FMN transferase [Kineosporiaceae bacterium]
MPESKTTTESSPSVGEPAEEAGYAHASWRALGTYVQLVVARGDLLEAAREEAVRVISLVDVCCSRFRDDSDLVRANREAGTWVRVRPVLADAVRAALWAAEETDGLVDPTLGRSLAAVGYDRDLKQVQADHGPSAIPVPLPATQDAWRQVGVRSDGDQAEVLVPFGVSLDLGATGKAFAADLAARQIADNIGTDLVISIGGDVAIGATSTALRPHQWHIAVGERPEDEPAQTVMVERGGVATSSTVHRSWIRGGDTVHHLLDPRTGRPVQRSWRTVTVAASSCLAANTATTASIVLGELAPAWLEQRVLAARLVGTDGTVVTVAGWPEEGS